MGKVRSTAKNEGDAGKKKLCLRDGYSDGRISADGSPAKKWIPELTAGFVGSARDGVTGRGGKGMLDLCIFFNAL